MMAYSERKFEQYFKSCGTGEDEGRQGRNLTGKSRKQVDVGPYTKFILPFYLFSPLLLVLVFFHTPIIRRRQKTTKQETWSRKQVLDSPLWAIPIKPHYFPFVAKPCAIALNIQANGPQIAQPNAILEKVFTAITKHPDEKRLEGLSKQLDWDVRSIQRWFRQRCNQEKPSTLRKFCESMWRFSFSLYVFTYGVRFLKKTPWLWNTRHCWYNYPYQPLTTDLHYYYILELSFYWSLMFSQFTDIKRKDFGIMFLHHLVAIFLISFSYVNNMARVGTLVLCLHDSADALLEAAKMANYAKFQKICDLLFVMFAMVFITTRLGIFPLWVLNTTLFESWEIVGPYPSWWVFNLLLLLIQGLNCFWSYLIVKIACKAISKGKAGKWNPLHVSKDDRSDIESSSDEEDSEPPGKNPHTATTTNGTSGTNGYLLTGSCSVDD
uniref:sphingosine N-acyltransferase n=2 Tax=Mustelidae TaxID=9655 RepID=M3XNS1_MUSPF